MVNGKSAPQENEENIIFHAPRIHLPVGESGKESLIKRFKLNRSQSRKNYDILTVSSSTKNMSQLVLTFNHDYEHGLFNPSIFSLGPYSGIKPQEVAHDLLDPVP